MICLAGRSGAPLLGYEGQEITEQCQQAPRAAAEGLMALRPLLSASYDIRTGKEPPLCCQLHPEFFHLDGMQYEPSHGY